MKKKITIIIFVALLIGITYTVKENKKIYLNEENIASNSKDEDEIETNIIEINENEFEEKVLKNEKKVVLDIYVDGCLACSELYPIIEEVAEEENIILAKVDVDSSTSIADRYGIKALPTLIVIEKGEVINRLEGLVSKEKIIEMLEN